MFVTDLAINLNYIFENFLMWLVYNLENILRKIILGILKSKVLYFLINSEYK